MEKKEESNFDVPVIVYIVDLEKTYGSITNFDPDKAKNSLKN